MGFVQEKLDAQHASRTHTKNLRKTQCIKTPLLFDEELDVRGFSRGNWTHIVRPRDALLRQHVISVKSRSRRLVFCLGRVGRILCVPGRTHRGLSGRHRSLDGKKPILAMILLLFPLMLLVVPKIISCGKARFYRTPNN